MKSSKHKIFVSSTNCVPRLVLDISGLTFFTKICFNRLEKYAFGDNHEIYCRIVRKPVFGVSDQVTQKLGCTFWIQEVKVLYYLIGKNIGIHQLSGYHAANLRLCFCTAKKQVLS